MSYVREHATALARIRARGFAANLTRKGEGTYNPVAGKAATTSRTLVGYALRVQGDAAMYREQGLVESESPTLLWVPVTYGDTPAEGDEVKIGVTKYVVKKVFPLAPDGTTVTARVVIVK